MPIPKKYLDSILDSVEKKLDELKKRMDSGDCDLETLKEIMMPAKPRPFQSDSPPETIHGHGSKDLFS